MTNSKAQSTKHQAHSLSKSLDPISLFLAVEESLTQSRRDAEELVDSIAT